MLLRCAPAIISASVRPRASMQVPHSRICPLPAIGHQRHGDAGLWLALDEGEGKAKAVVAPLGAVGRVIQNEQDLHGVYSSLLGAPTTPERKGTRHRCNRPRKSEDVGDATQPPSPKAVDPSKRGVPAVQGAIRLRD